METEQTKSTKIKQIINKAELQEDAKQTLIGLGVLIPFDSRVHAFHGRTNNTGEVFRVKPFFDNSGNATGNRNVNNIPGLHASSYEIANRYAIKRTEQFNEIEQKHPDAWKMALSVGIVKGTPEVHKIVASQPNLFIFDMCRLIKMQNIEASLKKDFYNISQQELDDALSYQLNKEDRKAAQKAISDLTLCTSVAEIMPHLFKNKNVATKILNDLNEICSKNKNETNKPYVFDSNLEEYILKMNFNQTKYEDLAQQIAGSINTYQFLAKTGNLPWLINKMQSGIDFCDDCCLNLQFVQNFLKKQNIVGVYQKIWFSKVIDRFNFEEYFFFDTTKINTEEMVKFQLKIRKKNREKQVFVQKSRNLKNIKNLKKLKKNCKKSQKIKEF